MTTSPAAALTLLLSWDTAGLRFEKGQTDSAPGVHRVTLTVNGITHEGTFTVRDDPLKTERW